MINIRIYKMTQEKYIVLEIIKRLIQLVTQFVYSVILKRQQIEPPSVLKTETVKYYETAKTKLLNTYESDYDANANIDAVFYDKPKYTEEMEIHNNEQELVWKRRILMDSTPRGNLIMYYDPYKLGFAYYSDVYMPYHILNAAAMKYVVMYRCRDFFVDELIVPETHPSKLVKLYFTETKKETTTTSNSNTDTTKSNTDVFAKLKNYNKPSSRVSSDATVTKELKRDAKQEKVKNVFINLGKTCNYCIIQKQPKKFATNGFRTGLLPIAKEMSWSEYKKLKSAPTSVKEETVIISNPIKIQNEKGIPKHVDDSTLFLPDDSESTYAIVKDLSVD